MNGAEKKALSFPEAGHAACFALEDESFWFRHRNECIVRALRREGFAGTFLDVGGGNGVVSKALEESGIRTVMLEPGLEGAVNARARGLMNVVCSTLEEASFREGSFAGAGLFDVIEHVSDDRALLRATHRVLAPRGVLCVTVPAYAWLWSDEDELAGHFRRYTLKELDDTLRSSGFTPTYATYFFAPLTVPIFFLRSLRHRFSKRKREQIEAGAAEQHTPRAPARMAMELLLSPEQQRVARGKRVPFGSSCLAVAVRA